jgi:plastocyanin
MRSTRLLAAGFTILAVAACASSTPGWTYAPAPSPTPVPSVDASASAGPSAPASVAPSSSAVPSATAAPAAPSGSAAPTASGAATVVQVAALNIAFDPTELSVPAGTPFQIEFANNDASIPHNVEIKDAAGATVFNGEIFNGVETRTYDVPALAAATYQFICSVHPNMVGALTAQ